MFHLVTEQKILDEMWYYLGFIEKEFCKFNIRKSVHRLYIRKVQPTSCNFSQFIYFCKTLYMFQTGFPSIIRSSKLYIQRQVFVRPLLLPAASPARLAAGNSNGLTLYVQFWAPDDGGKNRLKHVQRLTEINKLWNAASCWFTLRIQNTYV